MMKLSDTLKELIAGILFTGLICQLIGALFVTDQRLYACGLWIGVLLAMGMAVHMAETLDIGLDLGADAQKYISKAYALRTIVMFLIFGVTVYFQIGDVWACFLGIMTLKVSAYLQPFTDKLLQKARKNKK